MKPLISAAVAALVTIVTAQDGWDVWSSTPASSISTPLTTCPAPMTVVKTESMTVYEKTVDIFKMTITVSKPADSTTHHSEWKDARTSSKAKSTNLSASGCSSQQIVTKTTTLTSTLPGTVTSTLFVGIEATGSPDVAWEQSGSGSCVAPSGTGIQQGGSSNQNSGSVSGRPVADMNNFNGVGGLTGGLNNGNGANTGSDGQGGWGQGSWGGKGTGGLVIGTGDDVFHWEPKAPSNTKSGVAPVYTKGPHGWKGQGINVPGTWNSWGGSSNDGNNNGGGSGSQANSTILFNSTTSDTNPTNATTPKGGFGSPSSNVTKPFLPLKENVCNGAGDRGSWCNGLNLETNYYTDFWSTSASTLAARDGMAPFGGVCNYDLTITSGTWNMDGDDVSTFLINGQYPGPAIECNWGDLVTINVHNELETNGTTIHWHGIRQVGTNDQDGVPGVTECALAPGQSRTYTWRASSYGTGWYHSHWNLQYGDGVQGPIIIHGPATANYDYDFGAVMITDTYGGMSATAFGYISAHQGPQETDNYLLNGKNVKADLSAGQHPLWQVQKGKKYLFRLVNSAAQNMYSVSIDGHKMTVIAADFVPIQPYETEWVNIGIGQRYDVVVEMNQDVDTYFFRAVTQTLCPSASVNSGLGQANGIIAYEGVPTEPLPLPTTTLNGGKTSSDFQICNDEPLASLVPYLQLSAGSANAFSSSADTIAGGEVQKVRTEDEGDVYRWYLNNGAMYVDYTRPTLMSLAQNYSLSSNSTVFANQITLNQKDRWVYFVIQNQYFAYHPMHLHGHDFSVLGQGNGIFTNDMVPTLNFNNPIRRDTAMLAGASSPTVNAGYTVIGFETDNPGAWLMHCHIAWHVDGGLALQFIERPSDIANYGQQPEFQSECSAYGSYESQSTDHQKLSGQSGLRRREDNYFDRVMSEARRSMSVVRRDGGAHHYLNSHHKRTFGDGGNRRSFVHR